MNLKSNEVKLSNEDKTVTSCVWDTLKIEYELENFNTPDSKVDNGKSFKYNGEAGANEEIGPAKWNVFAGDYFFDASGNIIGRALKDGDTSLFKIGSYYHAGDNINKHIEIWVECVDPSHHSN